jgi:epoxide hydrolase 4
VAWHLAATRPEHCARLVVMNCPHPILFQRALLRPSQLKKSWYMFYFQIPWLPERALTRNGAATVHKIFQISAVDKTNFSREELAPILEAVQLPGAASGMLAWYRRALIEGLRQRGRLAAYPNIEAPSLLVWAMDDIALGYDELVPGTERVAPNLRVTKIERCGHFVQAERPDVVNRELLAFLAEGRNTTATTIAS